MTKNVLSIKAKKRPLVYKLFIWLLLTVQYAQILSPMVYAIEEATPSAFTAPTALTALTASDSAQVATNSGEIALDASPSALTASTAPTASSAAELAPDLTPTPTATPSIISDFTSPLPSPTAPTASTALTAPTALTASTALTVPSSAPTTLPTLLSPFSFTLSYPFLGSYPISYRYGEKSDFSYVSRMQSLFGVEAHDGVDWEMPEGTEVYAADSGRVVHAGRGDYGLTVIIEHSWGRSYYGHLSQTSVTTNDKINRGESLGLSGNTGITTAPHLHFGVIPKSPNLNNGYHGFVDPLPYFVSSDILGATSDRLFEKTNRKAKFRLSKQTLRADEHELALTFNAPQSSDINLKIGNPKGVVTDITENVLGSSYGPLGNKLSIDLDQNLFQEPGKYTLTITDGNGFYDEQDFTWGVLAINSDKAVYKSGDTAHFSLAVLDELGKMVCDANLSLLVTDPHGKVTNLSTSNGGIQVNLAVCSSYDFTLVPDFEASYQVVGPGIYQIDLSATTRTGSYSITSQIEVSDDNAYSIARSSATRLYPEHQYPMVIQITPKNNYQGLVTEKVPSNFAITPIDQTQVQSYSKISTGIEQVLSWDVDWHAGETYYLGYTYDAPDLSPAFYKLGPLTIGDYVEPRSWSLAIDAITYQTAGSANMTGANVTTISPDYPPSIAAGDLLVLMIGMKPSVANSGSVTTPSGWTAISGGSGTGGGYTTTLGADTGNTHVFSYYKIADGTEGKTPLTVSLTNRNITVAQMFRLSGSSGSWDLAAATGEDTNGADGNVSVAFTTDPGVTSGDYILGMYTIPTDATSNFSAHALTQTGVTFGTVTEVGDSETANGNDFGYTFWRAAVSSGTSSANPTYTATVGTTVTNGRGPGLFIRAREVAAPGVPTLAPDDGGSNQIVFSNNRQFDATPIVRAQATYGSTFDRFQVEFNTASDFTGTAYTETFSGTYSSATNYNLQTTGALSLPTTNGVTYYGRVRASADSGSHYGAWSSTLWTFTYKSSGDNDWHQTTDVQFNSDTLGNTTETNGSGAVQLATGYPEVKGWTSGSSASTSNSLTLYKPSGVQVNDLLIIIVGNDNTTATDQWDNTTYKPSGFTLINETGDTASDTHTGAFYRVADGTEASTIAVPAQSTMNYWGFYIRVVGASTSTPIDVTGVDVNSTAAATSLALTGVTTTVNNVLAFYASSYDGADGDPFGVTGTGWSETAEAESHAGTITAEANGSSGSWGTLQQATAGATGNATVTATISDTFAGFTFGIRPNNPTSGTIMSTEIDYDWVDGATSWGSLAFSTTETAGDVKLKLYYTASTACDTIVPDAALAGNSTGFDVSASPISITSLNTTTYNKICLQATLTDSGGTPTLNDWSVTWNIPTLITISGTANGNSGASIRYAYDGVLQSDTSDTISGGTWSIDNVTSPSVNQAITVWVDNVADANESTAVTKWSSGNVTGMVLDTNVISVGSSQNTSLTVTNLDSYDCTADEDIMYQAGTSHLKVEGDSCAGGATNSYSAEEIEILSGDTLTIGTSETLTTYDLTITGTLTSSGNSTYNVSHNWAKAGTFTESTSTVNLNGGGGTTQTITGTNTFYTLSATGSSARTIKFPSSVTTTVSNSLTLSGTSSQLLTLDPGTASTTWTISAPATTSVSYVSVSYSTNSGTSFCATYSTDGGNNTSWNITTTATCPVPTSSANSFQRKTWWDGTRYWRSYQNTTDNRIEFEYSTDGSSWTEDTSARISVDTNDFSVYGDSSNSFIAYTTSAVTSEDNLVIDSALKGYWKMNESSWNGTAGEVVDSSGSSANGVRQGNATTTTGKFSNGGTFDGTDDWVDLGTSANLDVFGANQDFSISMWIKRTSASATTDMLFSSGADFTGGVIFAVDDANADRLEFVSLNNTVNIVSNASALSGTDWQHVTVTANRSGNMTFYVNGVSVGSGSIAAYASENWNRTSGVYKIGRDRAGADEFDGLLDDVRVYNRALTSSEVATLANPGYDIEVREASSYPGTGFGWGNPTVVYNGTSSTDYYRYPTLAYDSNSKIWASASFYNTGSYTTNQKIVSASSDDAQEKYDDGTYNDTNTNIFTGGLTTTGANYYSGFRFTSIQIPKKAVISSAKIDLYNNWTGTYTTEKARLYFEANDDAATFSSGSKPSSRSLSTNYGTWSGSSESITAGNLFSSSTNFKPPELSSAMQEIIDRSGWAKGNDVAVIATPDATGTNGYYYDSRTQENTGYEPRLNVSWTASQIMAVQASSANDIATWGTAEILDTSTNTNKYGVIVPRASGAVYATWTDGTAIEGKNFNGTSWDTNPTSIDTGLSGLTKNISAVSDSSGNVYLTYVDDETTDQISARSFNGTSWSAQALVPDAAGASDAYPTITLDTTNSKVYVFWIDTSNSYIAYSSCTTSTGCDADSEWAAETNWKTTGTNTYISSNLSDAGKVYAQWTNGTTITWDKLSLGGNTAPNNPSSLAQKTTGDVTLATGDWHNTTSIKFTATATDTDNPDTLYLCVEKDILGTSFSNTEDSCGTGVAYSGSGVTVSVTISSQTDASEYHWQARIKDSAGAYSSWVSYDVNAESARDYGLDTTAPTGGTVYDGTGVGVDSTYNDGSLSSLSANWASFDSNASGLNKYQYSIGTSAGATDVKGWTDNSTTTSVTATSLTLNSSAVYYFNVRAVDNAGNTQSAVSSNGQRVAPSLSFSVGPASVAFANLNATNSYTDTKTTTLTTSTNAYNGYILRAFITDYLRSTVGSFTIPDFNGGTYASPATWGSSTGFGYTSSDTTIGGLDKFGTGTLYAPFSHTGPGDIVADHTSAVSGTPISNEQFTITYKVTAPTLQEAKNYTTTVVYTATAQY